MFKRKPKPPERMWRITASANTEEATMTLQKGQYELGLGGDYKAWHNLHLEVIPIDPWDTFEERALTAAMSLRKRATGRERALDVARDAIKAAER
jgi:hypothetical protein